MTATATAPAPPETGPAGGPGPRPGGAPETGTRRGLATMLASGASNQTGAALGAHAFESIGPLGVVAVRQLVAAAVLWPAVRPSLRRWTWSQWWPVLLLGLVFGAMNLSLYTAVDRIGLGLAVTLEFLGPLAVALAGARRLLDLVCAVGAGAGVYLLVLPDGTTDVAGVGLGLAAAACWAAYIVLNRLAGRRLPGLQATAAASGVAALLGLPVVAVLVAHGRLSGPPLLFAVAAGLLSSVVPYALDLVALRTVPTRVFGIAMSAHPVLAVLAGVALLGQVPAGHELVGIGLVVAANVAAVPGASRARTGQDRAHGVRRGAGPADPRPGLG